MQGIHRVFSLTFSVLIALSASAERIFLSQAQSQKVLTEIEFITDPSDQLSLESIVENESKYKFQPITDESLDKDIHTYWLKFSLSQDSLGKGDWLLDYHYWSYVDFYYLKDGQWRSKHTGRLMPYNQRDYPVANKSYIHIMLDQNESIECLVKVQTKAVEGLISGDMGFKIVDRDNEDQWNDTIGKVIFAFVGIFLVMFFYNLFIFLSTRLRSYALYLLVVAMTIYVTLTNAGYITSMLAGIEKFPYYSQFFYEAVSSALYGICILLFVQNFLKVKERYPKWNKVVNILLWMAVAAVVLLYIQYDIGNAVGGLFAFAMIIVIVALAVKSLRDKYPSAIYFSIGYAAFLFSLLLVVLAITGAIPLYEEVINFAVPAGATVQIVSFSMALANMINVLRHENDQKQLRIIAQLEENKELQTKVNRELEDKVNERTYEINKQKEQITKQKEAIEQEKEKSDELLLNILPESTANELKEKGYSAPRTYDSVSVLFTDFVRFTNIGEELKPEELVEELDHCFQVFDEIVYENHLEKIKTIGDSYMAAGGVPEVDQNNAYNAVKAALKIRDYIEKWNKEKVKNNETPWEIRIGVNNGPITAGVVGKKKFAYDIWGDTVNVASRMESSGIPGQVNISANTYALVKDQFKCTSRGMVEVKNKGELEIYLVDWKED